jgi:poly-gamma-glutamate capsule biosynthesis protein CapA/YwtB (metallophosphatase superfamily)
MYFVRVHRGNGTLHDLEMTPLQINSFRLNRATHADAEWLAALLDRVSRPFGTSVEPTAGNRLRARRA